MLISKYFNSAKLSATYCLDSLLAMRDKNADIIAIDPERELLPLIRALNGEIINISSTSGTHINALDINKDYTEKDGQNPVILA